MPVFSAPASSPFSFLCASGPVRKGSLLQKSLSFLLTRALSDMLSLQVEVNADMHVLHTCAAFPFFIAANPFLPLPAPAGASSCLLRQVFIPLLTIRSVNRMNLLPVFQALRLIPRPVIYRPVPAFFSLFFFLDDFPFHFVFPGNRIRRHLSWPCRALHFSLFPAFFL